VKRRMKMIKLLVKKIYSRPLRMLMIWNLGNTTINGNNWILLVLSFKSIQFQKIIKSKEIK